MLLATRPQVNRSVTVNPRLANRAVNRAFLQPALSVTLPAVLNVTLIALLSPRSLCRCCQAQACIRESCAEYRLRLRGNYRDKDMPRYDLNIAIFDTNRYIVPSLAHSFVVPIVLRSSIVRLGSISNPGRSLRWAGADSAVFLQTQ